MTDFSSARAIDPATLDIPEGFRAVSVGGAFIAHNGPPVRALDRRTPAAGAFAWSPAATRWASAMAA